MSIPMVVEGYTTRGLLQTLDNCGCLDRKTGGFCFPRAWQNPDILRYFAKVLWESIWLDRESEPIRFRWAIPDILVGMHECSNGDDLVPLLYLIGDQLGARADVRTVLVRRSPSRRVILDPVQYDWSPGKTAVIVQTIFCLKDVEDLTLALMRQGVEVIGAVCLVNQGKSIDSVTENLPLHCLIEGAEVMDFIN